MANLPTSPHPPPASTGDDYYTLQEAWMATQDDPSTGNLQTIENRVEGLSNLIVGTGLVADTFTPPLLSAGTGLSVNIGTFKAIVGIPIDHSGAGSVLGGLTPSTTNTVFLKQDGSFTSNTTGTNGGSTANPWIELGTVTTDASSVTGATDTYDVLPLPIGTTGTIPVGGDLSGTVAAATVIGLQGNPLPAPTAPEDGYVLAWDNTAGEYVWQPPDTGVPGGGTVTSVALTAPSWLSVGGSPVTTTGPLAVSAATGQGANLHLATPDGSTGAVGLRALAAGDIPTLSAAKISGGTFGAANASNLTNLDGADVVGNIPGNAANVTGTVAIGNGGTGQTNANAAFTALSPLTTLGDTLYHNGTLNVRLLGNVTTTRKFLRQVGNSSVSAAPAWDTLLAADIPTISGSQVSGGTFGAVNGSNLTSLQGFAVVGDIPGNANSINTTLGIAFGGTGAGTAIGAFNALSPLTTLGDILYGGAGGTGTRRAGNATTTRKFLRSTGSGGLATAPDWDTLQAVDIPTLDGSKISGGTLGATSGANVTNLNPANFSTVVPVTKGGTGLGSVTSGKMLQGNGTAALSEVTVALPLTLSGGVLTSTATSNPTISGVTLVVAASNSIDPTRADYQCDGTADQVEILAAITALGSIGGEVVCLEGDYSFSSGLTIAKSNVKLRGMGGGTRFNRSYDEAGANGLLRIGDSTNAYENIMVEDLVIDGVKTTYSSANNRGVSINSPAVTAMSNLSLSRVTVKNASGTGFHTGGVAKGVRYYRCASTGCNTGYNSAILSGGERLAYVHCSSDADVIGMVVSGDRGRVVGCEVAGATGTGAFPSGGGIIWAGCTNGLIANNTVTGCARTGMQCLGGTSSTGIKVVNNTVSGCHDFGMALDTLTDATVQNNTITGTLQFGGTNGTGIFLTNTTRVTLSGNTILDNIGYGVALATTAATTALQNNRVIGNTLGQILNSSTTTLFLGQSDGTDFVVSGQKVKASTGVMLPSLTSKDSLATDSSGNVIAGTGYIPIGGIILWSGSIVSIPANWHLCDGTAGTPNLRDKFVVGAGTGYAVGATGGADHHSHNVSGTTAGATANINDHASHTHSVTTSNAFTSSPSGIHASVVLGAGMDVYDGSHTHLNNASETVTSSGPSAALSHTQSNHSHTSGSLAADDVTTLPPYYALAYIMRVS